MGLTKSTDETLKKVKPDEPIFVLRAQDISAPEAVLFWVAINPQIGDEKRNEAIIISQKMREYRQRRKAD